MNFSQHSQVYGLLQALHWGEWGCGIFALSNPSLRVGGFLYETINVLLWISLVTLELCRLGQHLEIISFQFGFPQLYAVMNIRGISTWVCVIVWDSNASLGVYCVVPMLEWLHYGNNISKEIKIQMFLSF